MPRLRATHAMLDKTKWLRAAPGGTAGILARWAERVVPLIAKLLSAGIVCSDISRNNIMVDESYESHLIDLDSFLRITSAPRLEPAVGLVSLVPKRIWGSARLYQPEVLVYAMIFAALVSTVAVGDLPKNLYPVHSPTAVLKSHDLLMNILPPRTHQLVSYHLGDIRGRAQRFASTVFAF